MNAIKLQYAHLVDQAKPQWLENPKNIVYLYTQGRTGAPPKFDVFEAYVAGHYETIKRCTVVIDDELGIIAIGDGKSQKEAEKAAAMHGMLLLMERDFIDNPPPGVGAISKINATVARLSDGTEISLERAREFLDYVCHIGHYGKPDVFVEEVRNTRGQRNITAGWSANVLIGGTVLGSAVGSSKKNAQNAAMLNTALSLEKEDTDTWRRFDTTYKAGTPIGRAPPVFFHLSDELEEQMRLLYDSVRMSELYAKRPRITASFRKIDNEPAFKRTRRGATVTLAEEQHEAKSLELLERLNAYQTCSSVKNIREQRQALPVMQRAGDILVKVELNQVTLCMAATGSGKTTQIPQILLDDYILRKQGSKCNIICTQPRRIAAMSVAQRVAEERGESVGDTIGYQVRFDHKLPRPNGSITFCTTGVFLRRLQTAMNDNSGAPTFLDDLTHIMMDEVHERDVETDLLLVVIKRMLVDRQRRGLPEIKLVLMSATVDPQLFQNYFAELSPTKRPAPVVEIPGRSFPVEKYFLEETYARLKSMNLARHQGGWVCEEKNVRDYIDREIMQKGGPVLENTFESTVDALELPYGLIALMIADVLSRSDDGHVLVFMPGLDEIKNVHHILTNTRQYPLLDLPLDDQEKYEIHVLHSSIPVAEQQAVFKPVRHPGIRRILLATNIAETSITIPDVVYVIDTGRVKEKRYDPQRHLSSLVSAWVGTSNLNQRAGRAGRHRAGEYYGVLSLARYNRLNVHQTVEMKRVDLSNVVMHIKALSIPGMDVESVLAAAIEPPEPERVKAAMSNLERIGALDFHRNLTSLGNVLLQLPLEVSIGKMCLYGAFFRCLDPVLSLAAVLTNRDPFMAPPHLKKEANMIKDSWSPHHFRSDPLCVLNAFYKWTSLQRASSSQANRFLANNMLSRATMLQIQQVKQNLFQSLEKADVIQVIRSSSAFVPRYRRRVRETDPEFNINSHSTPMLCALIAVASSPNFAVRSGERSYRTAQDKTCFIHPSSVCHYKFTKDKGQGAYIHNEKDIYAFAEKSRNTSTLTAGSHSNAMTMLRSCTRLDPLTYMLFGASEARALGHGLECDEWLPVTGSYDALDTIERLKVIMDECMLRVFEGIGKRRPSAKFSSGLAASVETVTAEARDALDSGNNTLASWNSDEDEDADESTTVDRSLSPREIEDFETLTTGIVKILDSYAAERSWSQMT